MEDRIETYEFSFNTRQAYTHYSVSLPQRPDRDQNYRAIMCYGFYPFRRRARDQCLYPQVPGGGSKGIPEGGHQEATTIDEMKPTRKLISAF
jgi:hypothetical protein